MSILQTGRILVVAFEGWNDAGEAASGAAKVIARELQADVVAAIDTEDYYDFQFSRPMVSFDENGLRQLSWPTTEFYAPGVEVVQAQPQQARVHVLVGVEPSRRWKAFTGEVLEMIEDREIDAVIFLGSLLADVPHTRAIATTITSQNAGLRAELDFEKSDYEGPVGILSVLGMALEAAGTPTISIWASVPHYAHTPPVPKASLAVLVQVEQARMERASRQGDRDAALALGRIHQAIAEANAAAAQANAAAAQNNQPPPFPQVQQGVPTWVWVAGGVTLAVAAIAVTYAVASRGQDRGDYGRDDRRGR